MADTKTFPIKKILLALFICLVIGYTLFRLWPVLFGVRIKLNPLIQDEGLVLISGNALHANLLTINDLPISTDESGDFAFPIASLSGINRARIFAKDKFGHSRVKLLEWYYINPNPLDVAKHPETVPDTESEEQNNGIQESTKETDQSGINSR